MPLSHYAFHTPPTLAFHADTMPLTLMPPLISGRSDAERQMPLFRHYAIICCLSLPLPPPRA
jgi:hypothetical protein